MAKRNNILPTAAEKLQAEPGYAANGMSLYSRTARKPRGGGGAASRNFVDRPPPERQEWSRLDALIKHETYEVERLERRAAEAKGTDKHAKICVRLQRTRHLLARLRAEQKTLVS